MKDTNLVRSLAKRLLSLVLLAGLPAAIYFFAIRPSALRWGATAEEAARPMPGDELVPSPDFLATRAVTIHAKPEAIWPWLAQMGYRRAGFYGYDLIENMGSEAGIRSATSILPALQHPNPGDVLPISAVASMIFGAVQPPGYLVWRGRTTPSDGSIVWALYPVDASHTRLVSRVRLRYHWASAWLLFLDMFTEFGDHVAVPRILLGVKGLVEGRAPQSLAPQAAQIAVWLVALAELAASMVLVICLRRWGRAWLFGLGAGLLFLFVLYAPAPVWTGAALSCGILAGILWLMRASLAAAPASER